jgi:hypothetical protein
MTFVFFKGKSYGDVGDLYLVHKDGSAFVKLNQANVQEACWHPTRNEVVYIEGKCPSGSALMWG